MRYGAPTLLVGVALALRWYWPSQPLSVVFDETFWGRVAMMELRHEFAFDIHPPLARLIFWFSAWLADLDPSFKYASNGLAYPNASYLALRIAPRLAGIALPLIIYGLGLEIGLSRIAAFLAGLLVALDNALIVVSRLAMADIFLLTFGFAALFLGLRAIRKSDWRLMAAAGLSAGAALSVKWTGASFLGLLLAILAVRSWRGPWLANIGRAALIILLATLIYVGCFLAEFKIATKASADNAFIDAPFQATLTGSAPATVKGVKPLATSEKFFEINRLMAQYAVNQHAEHAYFSKWYDWPFMMRTLDMWSDEKPPLTAHIFLLGNPAIWWLSGYAALFLLVNLAPKLLALAGGRGWTLAPTEAFLIGGYLLNMLPFIAISRGMFIYHYLPALVFAIVSLAYLLDQSGAPKRLGIALVAIAIPFGVYFAPLTYGFAQSHEAYDRMFWVQGWRN